MKKITRNELVEAIRTIKGTGFLTLFYTVDESKSRTVNKEKLLTKKVENQVTINSDYEKKINRIRENKQGEENSNFVAQEMKGKKLISDDCKCLVTDEKTESKVYIYATVENHVTPKTVWFDRQGKVFDYVGEVEKAKKLIPEILKADNSDSIKLVELMKNEEKNADAIEAIKANRKERSKVAGKIFKDNNIVIVPSAILAQSVGRGSISAENKVDVFTLNIENLTGVNMKGEKYQIVD